MHASMHVPYSLISTLKHWFRYYISLKRSLWVSFGCIKNHPKTAWLETTLIYLMILWASNSDWIQSSGPYVGLLWDLWVYLQSPADHLGGCASCHQQCWATCFLTSTRLAQACSHVVPSTEGVKASCLLEAKAWTWHNIISVTSYWSKKVTRPSKFKRWRNKFHFLIETVSHIEWCPTSFLFPSDLCSNLLIRRLFPEHPIKIVPLSFYSCPIPSMLYFSPNIITTWYILDLFTCWFPVFCLLEFTKAETSSWQMSGTL